MSRRLAIVVTVALFALGAASFATTLRSWDSGFSRARYEVSFKDASSRTVWDVTLHVDGDTRDCRSAAGRWPVLEGPTVRANEQGLVVFHQAEDGVVQFGGTAFDLFWLIRIDLAAPRIPCEFVSGNGECTLDFRELDAMARRTMNPQRVSSDGPGERPYPVVALQLALR